MHANREKSKSNVFIVAGLAVFGWEVKRRDNQPHRHTTMGNKSTKRSSLACSRLTRTEGYRARILNGMVMQHVSSHSKMILSTLVAGDGAEKTRSGHMTTNRRDNSESTGKPSGLQCHSCISALPHTYIHTYSRTSTPPSPLLASTLTLPSTCRPKQPPNPSQRHARHTTLPVAHRRYWRSLGYSDIRPPPTPSRVPSWPFAHQKVPRKEAQRGGSAALTLVLFERWGGVVLAGDGIFRQQLGISGIGARRRAVAPRDFQHGCGWDGGVTIKIPPRALETQSRPGLSYFQGPASWAVFGNYCCATSRNGRPPLLESKLYRALGFASLTEISQRVGKSGEGETGTDRSSGSRSDCGVMGILGNKMLESGNLGGVLASFLKLEYYCVHFITLEVIMFCAVDYSGVMQSKKIDSRHELMRMRLAIWGTRGFGNVVERDTGIREYGILVTCKLVGLLAILDMLSAILFQ
ncbi:hypothetical protein EYC84_005690 [Monilinia fructicola]|uniref:Uncharacterized protein n=1 Tax=Monilinia fructicola TaxID=38448 RepID=A0A5M9K219_MONFR|nr:hypothetical protein EYC84_005690 [Monilinia fructicola]